jgi:hypothetical protein
MWLLNGWWSHGRVWLYNAIIKTDTLRKAKRKNMIKHWNLLTNQCWDNKMKIKNIPHCRNNSKIYHTVGTIQKYTTLSEQFRNIPHCRNNSKIYNTPCQCRNIDYWADDTKNIFDIHFTEFGAVMATVLPVLFKYCYKYCYSDSRKLWAVMKGGGLAL